MSFFICKIGILIAKWILEQNTRVRTYKNTTNLGFQHMCMCRCDFVAVSLIGCFCDWQSNLLSQEEGTFFKDNNSFV